jgi:hypothetical protein
MLRVMSLKWRWCLVVVMAATVLGGFMPRTLLSDSVPPARALVASTEGVPAFPVGCLDATCGKGAPTPSAPVLTIAALAAIAAVMLSAGAGPMSRRFRSAVRALPSGRTAGVFRPPQFS